MEKITWVTRATHFLQEKVAFPTAAVSGSMTMIDYFDIGWRIVTGVITLAIFYFQWRKHRMAVEERHEKRKEHQKKMLLIDAQLAKEWREK